MEVKLLRHTPEPEKTVAMSARLCYSPIGAAQLEEKISDEQAAKLVRKLVEMGHFSTLEHVTFTFAIEGVSRVLTHQLVRHRIASYSQQSQRYVKEHDFETIVPPTIAARPEAKEKFEKLMAVTDISLVDIKHIDSAEHKKLTGFPNENILDMVQYMSAHGDDMWIRHVLVPERTDFDPYLKRLGDYIATLDKNVVQKVEILPYHTLGVKKYHELGITYPLEGIEPPSAERVKNAENLLHVKDYTGWQSWRPKPVASN